MWSLLRRNPGFRTLSLAQLISTLGDWLTKLALPFYVFSTTGSALATAGTVFALLLPQVVFGPIAGVFVDRYNRKMAMVLSHAVASLLLAFLVLADARGLLLQVVYPVLLLQGCSLQFFITARAAVTPTLVETSDLVAANSVVSLVESVGRLIGPPLGGVLLAAVGFELLICLDIASFLIAIALLLTITVAVKAGAPTGQHEPGSTRAGVVGSIVSQIREGVGAIVANRMLRALACVGVATSFANGAVSALIIPYARQNLGLESGGVGTLLASQAAGAVLAAPFASRLARRRSPFTVLVAAMALSGGALVLFSALPFIGLSHASLILFGAPGVMILITGRTIVMTETPDALLGRVISGFTSMLAGSMAMGAVLGGVLSEAAAASVALRATGAMVVLGAAALALTSPAERAPAEEPGLAVVDETT
jgi:MFS family permease